MPEQLQKIIQPLKARWDVLTKQQKIKLIAAVLVVLLALVVTVYFTTRTNYVPFVKNLDGNQYIQIENVLNEAGIKNKPADNNTTIMVDRKRLGEAKVQTDTNPALSAIPFTFADAFSVSGMSATESVRRQALLLATKYDLEEDLMGYDGVVGATVQLYIPEQTRLITRTQEKSTVAVQLQTGSRVLTRNEGLAIARFLCRSVEGLEMENIEITDSNYNTIYSGSQDVLGMGVGSVAEMREADRNRLMSQVRNLFVSMFDEVQVAPNLTYDASISTESRISTISPPVTGSETGVPLQDYSRSSTAQGSPTSDAPGTDANDQITNTYDTGNDNTYKGMEKENETTYGYNQSEVVSQTGPGQYLPQNSSIVVSLKRYIPHYQETLIKQDKNFSQADWLEYQRTNKEVAVFDDPNLDLYTTWIANATGMNRESVSVSIMEVPVFYPYTKPPVAVQQIIMFAVLTLLILMLAYGLIRRTKIEEEEEEVEPELSVEDLLVSTQLEEAKEEAEKLEDIDYFKDSETKRQIEKFVNEKPEAVAQLLRNWLNNEDWS